MADRIRMSGVPAETSPWPVIVALGLTVSEVGVLLGIRPMTVGGLVVFVGAVTGLLHETGTVTRRTLAVGAQGAVLIGIGLLLVTIPQAGVSFRGRSIIIAGMLCVLSVPCWWVYRQV